MYKCIFPHLEAPRGYIQSLDGIRAIAVQGLHITIAMLGHMGSFVF